MSADHDDLILERGVSARNLGDGVEAVFVFAGEFGLDVDFDGDGYVGLREPVESSIAFDCGHGYGYFDALFGDVRGAAQGCAVVVEEGSAGTAAIFGIAAWLELERSWSKAADVRAR
jgi:hypothetical protein